MFIMIVGIIGISIWICIFISDIYVSSLSITTSSYYLLLRVLSASYNPSVDKEKLTPKRCTQVYSHSVCVKFV